MNHESTRCDLEMFYDGACPICCREVDMLRRLDRDQRVRFVDIAAPAFDAATTGASHRLRLTGRRRDAARVAPEPQPSPPGHASTG